MKGVKLNERDGLDAAHNLTTANHVATMSDLPNPASFATAAQGALAETAVQPEDLTGLLLPATANDGDILKYSSAAGAWVAVAPV